MDKQVDPAVQERIRALCRQITVAHDLDAEIQEELYGHMEDKLLAYLAGEEKLSPDDAFILMREHFGNPVALQEILQAVHEPNEDEDLVGMRVSLPRRLAAALVATMAVLAITNFVFSHLLDFLAVPLFTFGAALTLGVVSYAGGMALLWKLLYTWQNQLVQGRESWFVRWPAHRMWITVGAALAVPFLKLEGALFHAQPGPYPGPINVATAMILLLAIIVAQQCAWFWWADRPPRAPRSLEWAFLSLVCLNQYFALTKSMAVSIQVSDGKMAPDAALTWATLLDWQQMKLWWSANGHEAPLQLLHAIAFQLAVTVILTLVSYGVYILARRIQRWTANRSAQGQVVA